jgi:predicted metal-dependent enzyme (double-stranded beta helix superfamily)
MSTSEPDRIAPLREFVVAMTQLVGRIDDEAELLDEGRALLAALVADDGWLPDAFARPDPHSYRQYLLHADPLERFSVVSFVWGPGQRTPIHDHTVWGLIGMLRGAERCRRYARDADGRLRLDGDESTLRRGEVDAVSPRIGDLHVVANALEDAPSVSIHVYGANIGAVRRHVFDAGGAAQTFVSGYSSEVVPNLWDRSEAVRGG